MERYMPHRAVFEPQALDYEIGRQVHSKLIDLGIPVTITASHNRVTGITGKTAPEAFASAKNTLAVGVRKNLDFASCKPSAHYQLPLTTSCPGMCEYCYLSSTLGKKPYLRLYVNIDDVLQQAQKYIDERAPELTIFEGAATSDPIPTEYLSGLLFRTIDFFGGQQFGRFRFVTKFTDVDSLLMARHNGHTRFRFSINAPAVVERFEHRTSSVAERIQAAAKVAQADYPIGFILAPIFLFPGWQQEYEQLISALSNALPAKQKREATFECITHRFTRKARNQIMEIFPQNALPFNENERVYKYGQFGYGKYVYTKEMLADAKANILQLLNRYFPEARIEYFI